MKEKKNYVVVDRLILSQAHSLSLFAIMKYDSCGYFCLDEDNIEIFYTNNRGYVQRAYEQQQQNG